MAADEIWKCHQHPKAHLRKIKCFVNVILTIHRKVQKTQTHQFMMELYGNAKFSMT